MTSWGEIRMELHLSWSWYYCLLAVELAAFIEAASTAGGVAVDFPFLVAKGSVDNLTDSPSLCRSQSNKY